MAGGETDRRGKALRLMCSTSLTDFQPNATIVIPLMNYLCISKTTFPRILVSKKTNQIKFTLKPCEVDRLNTTDQ